MPEAVPRKSLIQEISEFWRGFPHRALFLTLLAIWTVFFHFLGNSTFGYIDTPSLFGWVNYAYNNSEDDAIGFVIPIVILVIFWWRKDELSTVPRAIWWPALALVAFALLIHAAGYVVQQTRLSIVAYAIGVYGLMGLVWGPAWLRASFFPMFLLAFFVPISALAEPITFPLRLLVTKISVGVSHHLLGIDVFYRGSQIFDGQGKALYDVAPACSGIRSLIALSAFMMIYAFLTFKKAWKRILFVILAMPLAVAGNAVRITTVIIVGDAFGPAAGAMIEQKFGFITFAVAISSALLLGYLLRENKTSAELQPPIGLNSEVEGKTT